MRYLNIIVYALFFIVAIGHCNKAIAIDGIFRADMQNMSLLENIRVTNYGVVKEFKILGKNVVDVSIRKSRSIVEGYRLSSDYGNAMRSIFFKFGRGIVGFIRNAEYTSLRNIVGWRLAHIVNDEFQRNGQPGLNIFENNRTWNNIGAKLSFSGVACNIDLPTAETGRDDRSNERQNRYKASKWIFVFLADIIVAYFVVGWYFKTGRNIGLVYILFIYFIGADAVFHSLKDLFPN